jgi:hypothetical protein
MPQGILGESRKSKSYWIALEFFQNSGDDEEEIGFNYSLSCVASAKREGRREVKLDGYIRIYISKYTIV